MDRPGLVNRERARHPGRMTRPPRSVFGYGSLVNPATHDYAGLRPARLSGWRRAWRQSPDRATPYLTVERAAGEAVGGAVADPPEIAWPALDAREAGYERHDVGAALRPGEDGVVVYALARALPGPATGPIRLSYLDVVAQGMLRFHGAAGAAELFERTDGWGPVLDDRAAPRYARAQALAPEERRAVDDGLRRIGVVPLADPDGVEPGS